MIDHSTPIGAHVLADVDDYPTGYAQGNARSKTTARGMLHAIEGDAGIGWCFVRLDDPGDGPEYMHVPMERVDLEILPVSSESGRRRHDGDGRPIIDVATCGACGRSWDDALVTSLTPAPSGRCPFEYDHDSEEDS